MKMRETSKSKLQNTPGMSTMEYNGIKQKSSTKKHTWLLVL